MKRILPFIMILLAFAACGNSKKAGNSTEDFSDIVIIYAETPCYGECPVYNMVLDGSKMLATFKGESHTPKIGTYTKSISATEFAGFIEALEKANFNAYNDEYMGNVPDFPIREITVTKKGKTKKVRNRSEAPASLGELEKVFKAFANSDNWTKETVKD